MLFAFAINAATFFAGFRCGRLANTQSYGGNVRRSKRTQTHVLLVCELSNRRHKGNNIFAYSTLLVAYTFPASFFSSSASNS